MKRIIILLPILASFFFGCAFMPNINGSGEMTELAFDYSGFDVLDIRSAFEVTLVHDDAYSVTVMVDDNVTDKVETYRSGDTLLIGLNDSYRYTDVSLRAVVTMPTLTGINASDASSVTVIDSVSFPSVTTFSANLKDASQLLLPSIVADSLTVKIEDASRLNIGAMTSDATVIAEDASRVQMSGSSSVLTLNVGDASVATLKEFSTSTATVKLKDASEAWVYVNGILNVNLTGASTLYYRGAVDIGTLTLAEASSIIQYSH
jgi:hypothetical protein